MSNTEIYSIKILGGEEIYGTLKHNKIVGGSLEVENPLVVSRRNPPSGLSGIVLERYFIFASERTITLWPNAIISVCKTTEEMTQYYNISLKFAEESDKNYKVIISSAVELLNKLELEQENYTGVSEKDGPDYLNDILRDFEPHTKN